MNLQTRKLNFIQKCIDIDSEETMEKLEAILSPVNSTVENKKFSPLSMDDFNKRILASLNNIKKGQITESKTLLNEIKQWT